MLREIVANTKVLSDENRVRIRSFISGPDLCVRQIIELLGLAILKQARLVDSQKKGRWIYFRLSDQDVTSIVTQATESLEGSLSKDKQIEDDREQLKLVQKSCLEGLCVAYAKGNRDAA